MSLIWNCENAFFYNLITFIMSFSSFISGGLPETIQKEIYLLKVTQKRAYFFNIYYFSTVWPNTYPFFQIELMHAT